MWCQIGLVTRRKQAIASSVAYKAMHKRTQMWFKGMKCLCSRRISKWTERPEPDPQVNIFPSSRGKPLVQSADLCQSFPPDERIGGNQVGWSFLALVPQGRWIQDALGVIVSRN